MEKLPQDIKLEIFSRVPAESILEYKLVCKSWLSILKDPSFPQIHLRRQLCLLNNDDTPDGSPTVPCGGGGGEYGFILLAELDDSQLLYGKYDENDEQSSYRIVRKINHPVINSTTSIIIGSCNGLICLSIPSPTGGDVIGDPTYIFNPITREYVNLPRLFGGKRCSKLRYRIMSGFGYHPSINEYKVVRIFYPDYTENLGKVQVYTLGAGSGWRDKGEVANPFPSMCMVTSQATFANGKLHWLDRKVNIVAFDLADEEFNFIPSPPIVYLDGQWNQHDKEYSFRLCELGGWLGLAHYVSSEIGRSSHVDIWSLKKKSTTGYGMKEKEDECWGWSKELTIPTDGFGNISPFAITKRGEFLFWETVFNLCRYDPKSATTEELEPSDGKKFSIYNEAIIPHINSFVSLKALGEKCRRRIKYLPK